MAYTVNFKEVETTGLEASPVADVLAGLRANEARYFWNKYKQEYVVYTLDEKPEILPFIEKVLAERDMVFPYTPLNVAQLEVDGILWSFVFMTMAWQLMSSIRLKKVANERSVSNCQTALKYQKEFEGKFKFARQRSKLAGEIRGTFLLSRVIIYRVVNLGKPRFFSHT